MRITLTYHGLRPLVRYEPRQDAVPHDREPVPAQIPLPLPLNGNQRPDPALKVRTGPMVPPLAPDRLHRMFTAILEAYDGRRPPAQLHALLDPALAQRLAVPRQPTYRGYRLYRPLRAQYPMPWVIEASATVRTGDTAHGFAARFECARKAGRWHWRCTRFESLSR